MIYITPANSTNPRHFMYGSFSSHLSLYTYFLFTDGHLCCFRLLTSPVFILHGCNICPPYLLRLSKIAQGIFQSDMAALCMLVDSWLLFRMQSSKSCTPQCHSLRLLCVCIFCLILSEYLMPCTLASWSYHEPFFERYVYLASITTALGVT